MGAPQGVAVEDFEQGLVRAAARIFPGARIRDVVRLTGGASLQTWRFDVVHDDQISEKIVRRLPPGQAPLMNSVSLAVEARVIAAAQAAGVPVAPVSGLLVPEDGVGDGFIATRMQGEALPHRLQKDEAYRPMIDGFAAECGRILARIHSTPLEAAGPLAVIGAVEQLDAIERSYRSRPLRSPVFEATLAWLRQRFPAEPPARRLVHGDFRLGNLMISPDAVTAVLDWELAHLGDPAEDLGWVTVNSWRFGRIDQPVGGFGSIEDMLSAYVAEGGEPIDPDRILFWRALGSLRWGVACGEMSDAFLRGEDQSVERGMIARRVSETELDLLDIIAPERPHA